MTEDQNKPEEQEFEFDTFDQFDTGISTEFAGFDFEDKAATESEFIRPKKRKELREEQLYFEHAEKLAREIDLQENDEIFCFLSGNFVFGDFLEALFYHKNIYTEKLQISTLSMNYQNVLSLRNLMKGKYVKEIDLIVSDYFYAHERNDIIKELYTELNYDGRFQLAVAAQHTKIINFKTEGGKHIVIHGSANLRSSNCIEQMHISQNETLYNFVKKYNDEIVEAYKTINKGLRGNDLWHNRLTK